MKTLYRPIGVREYILIKQSGYKAFPPRLDWQPIFYPVLNQAYAEQIAHDWNTQDEFSGYCGLVTSFNVNSNYLQRFPVQNVGSGMHDELWVPAEELLEFNDNIVGGIRVVNAFFGDNFSIGKNEIVGTYYDRFK